MELREFTLDDYEEVVDMFYDINKDIYQEHRKIGSKYFYYKKVSKWIEDKHHIILSVNNIGVITGFTMCYVDYYDGLTEPYYMAEIAYVKPEYRNTRAAYLLYNNAVKVAEELNLNINSNSRLSNGVDKMVQKHFKVNALFTNIERKK